MVLNKNKFEVLSHRLSTKKSANLTLFKELPFSESPYMYYADTLPLYCTNLVRDLGIFFDNELSWNSHLNIIHKKSKQLSSWILHTFHTRNKTVMLMLFKSLVRSKLEFGCEIWNPYLKKDIVLIEQVQRVFTSRISFMRDLNYWQRLKILQLMSLQRRRERAIIIYVWKIIHNVYPNSINLNFKTQTRINALRAIIKPLPRVQGRLLTVFDNSFEIQAARLWNVLPPSLTWVDSLSLFISKLDKFLWLISDEPPLPGYPHKNNNSLTEQKLP